MKNGHNLRGEKKTSAALLSYIAGLGFQSSLYFGVGVNPWKPAVDSRKLRQKSDSGIVKFALSQPISEFELKMLSKFESDARERDVPVPPLFCGVLSPYKDDTSNQGLLSNQRFNKPGAFVLGMKDGKDPFTVYANTIAKLKDEGGIRNFYHVGGLAAIMQHLRLDRASE